MRRVVTILGTSLQIKAYMGKRVVTFKDIDTLHCSPEGTASRIFRINRLRFVSGVDFFKISLNAFCQAMNEPMDAQQSNESVTLITESGYLMLAKFFTDDLAWRVQRELIDTYFRVNVEVEERRMNNLQIFNNAEFGQIRTTTIDGEPWFVGKDVAEILGYESPSSAVSKKVAMEDKQFCMLDIADCQNGNLPIGQSKTAIINESGLYSLILSSKLPSATKFKHWVTNEVLPTLRKTGHYSVLNEEQNIQTSVTGPEIFLEAARIMASIPDSQRYVINCLRSVVPDIDELPAATDQAKDDVDKTNPLIQRSGSRNVGTETTVSGGRSFSKPFNYNQFNNYLIENKISRKDLQAEIGCSANSISRWATGQSRPKELHRIKLCQVLNLPIGYFDNSKRVRRIQRYE